MGDPGLPGSCWVVYACAAGVNVGKTSQPCGEPEGDVLGCHHQSLGSACDKSDDGATAIKPSSTGCVASLVAFEPTLAASGVPIVVIMLGYGSAQGVIGPFRPPRDFTMLCLRNNARSW